MIKENAYHQDWIGCARAVAIFGVMVFHAGERLAMPALATRMSFVCVVLFFLLSGVTAALSMLRHPQQSYPAYLKRRLPSFLLPYLCVCCCYAFARTRLLLSAEMLLKTVTFSYEVHLYYIFVYLQLTLVAPLLMRLVRACCRSRHPALLHALALAAVSAFSYACMRWTDLLPLSGNGRFLLGGNYLPCFYFGMVLGCCKAFSAKAKTRAVTGVAGLACWLLILFTESGYADLSPAWLFRWWEFNPPSVLLVLQSVSMLFACYGIFSTLSAWRYTRFLTRVLNFIGSNSIYIYLYLLLIRTFIFNRIPIANLHLLRLTTFAGMLLVPIVGKLIWDLVFRQLKRIYYAGRPEPLAKM